MTKEQYIEWRNNRVTQEFIDGLKTERFELQEAIAEGKTVGIETERTIGQCQGLKHAVVFALEGLKELIIDKENENDNS